MKIVICLDGGLVQQVALADVPKDLQKPITMAGLVAEIRDYDVEGVEPEEVQKDDAGNEFVGRIEPVIW
jgi:hypothetical protein